MLVVCDASPLNLLVRIELIHILPALFGKVIPRLLERAADAGLISIEQAFNRVRHTDFYVSDDLLDEALRRHSQRHN